MQAPFFAVPYHLSPGQWRTLEDSFTVTWPAPRTRHQRRTTPSHPEDRGRHLSSSERTSSSRPCRAQWHQPALREQARPAVVCASALVCFGTFPEAAVALPSACAIDVTAAATPFNGTRRRPSPLTDPSAETTPRACARHGRPPQPRAAISRSDSSEKNRRTIIACCSRPLRTYSW